MGEKTRKTAKCKYIGTFPFVGFRTGRFFFFYRIQFINNFYFWLSIHKLIMILMSPPCFRLVYHIHRLHSFSLGQNRKCSCAGVNATRVASWRWKKKKIFHVQLSLLYACRWLRLHLNANEREPTAITFWWNAYKDKNNIVRFLISLVLFFLFYFRFSFLFSRCVCDTNTICCRRSKYSDVRSYMTLKIFN